MGGGNKALNRAEVALMETRPTSKWLSDDRHDSLPPGDAGLPVRSGLTPLTSILWISPSPTGHGKPLTNRDNTISRGHLGRSYNSGNTFLIL